MRKVRSGIYLGLCLLVAAFVSQAFTKAKTQDGKKSFVKIQLSDYRTQMKYLQGMEVDVTGVNLKTKVVDALVTDGEIRMLTGRSDLKIISQTEYVNLMPDEGYHTPEEVIAELQAMAATYPTLAKVSVIGKTVENREIWAIKISDNVAEHELNEPTVLFNAMHHAREIMTTEVAMDTAQQLLQNYGKDTKTTHWVDSNEIWIVPQVNPDGNNTVWTDYAMWRKNMQGGYGVDINRNYPYAWNTCNGSSGSTGSETYRGPTPGSEPETQAQMNIVTQIRPVFDISYHSYSELVLYPYGCSGVHAETRDVIEKVGNDMANLLPSDDDERSHYTPGTPWETLYDVDGGDIDWMYHERQVIPFVIEMNSGSQGFQPDYADWRDVTVLKLRKAWGFILDRLDQSGIRGVVTASSGQATDTVITVKNLTDTTVRDQLYKVNPDGTYHIVLNPGNYHLTFNGPETQEHDVTVGASRVDMNVTL